MQLAIVEGDSVIGASRPSKGDVSVYFDPDRDPASVMPDYAARCGVAGGSSAPPSVEDVKAALDAHVIEGVSAKDMIQRLFSPFLDAFPYEAELSPGAGKKRPSYQISIPMLGIMVPRLSTQGVAEILYRYAERLAECKIGNRAPEGAMEFNVSLRGESYYRQGGSMIAIRAKDPEELRRAVQDAFFVPPAEIHAPIDMSREDFLQHVRAAREEIERNAQDGSPTKRMALELIAAVADLRIATTCALRRLTTARRFQKYNAKISLGNAPRVVIEEQEVEVTSSHMRLAARERLSDVYTAIDQALARHPIFSCLPSTLEIEAGGEAEYLSIDLVDAAKPRHDLSHRLGASRIEYTEIDDLTAWLENALQTEQPHAERTWKISYNGTSRSSSNYTLTGPTLSAALVRHFQREKASFMSLKMADMEIDLIAPVEENDPKFHAYRVIA